MERLRYSEFELVGRDTAKLRGPYVDILVCGTGCIYEGDSQITAS